MRKPSEVTASIVPFPAAPRTFGRRPLSSTQALPTCTPADPFLIDHDCNHRDRALSDCLVWRCGLRPLRKGVLAMRRSILSAPVELVDGPLVSTRRADLVARMSQRLVDCNSFATERDAMRALVGNFGVADIMMLIDDARQAAMQHVVAREMSWPSSP